MGLSGTTLYIGTSRQKARLAGVPARYAAVVWLAAVPPASSRVDPSRLFSCKFPRCPLQAPCNSGSPAILGLSQITGSSCQFCQSRSNAIILAHFLNSHPISPAGNLTCSSSLPHASVVLFPEAQIRCCDATKNLSPAITGCVHSHHLIEPAG